jgi:protein involved in polysaccharide export with SLBB domain
LLESCTKAGIVNLEFAGSDLQAEGPSTVTVNILGAVGNPGAFQFRNGGSLLDLLAAAGGWTENGDLQRIQISVPAATEAQVHDLTAILSGKAVNPILQPGAVIEVSKK